MAGKVSAPPQNPFLTTMATNDLNQSNSLYGQGPTTSLPTSMQSNVSLPNAVGQANQADAGLQPFLQMNASNPLFNQEGAAQKKQYQDKYFDNAIAPSLGSAAEQQWLGGNLGTSGESTFGSNYLSNLEASGRNQAFFSGQQYYDDLLNNFHNNRSDFFGNEVQPAMQADEFNQEQNRLSLGSLNQQKLSEAQGLGSNAGATMGWANNQQNQQLQASAATAQNRASLLGGIGGLVGGGLGMLSGGGSPGGFFGSGGGGGSSLGTPGSQPFPRSSFMNIGANY